VGNTVSYDRRPDIEPLEMSNGLTSVFVSVVSLAASRLAQTPNEQVMAAWFGSRDQGAYGSGVVGFDVGDMPWSSSGFPGNRGFVLRTIAAAKTRVGWDALGYEPRADWLAASLDHFAGMVEAFSPEDIAGSKSRSWPWGMPERLSLCAKHKVFQHVAGCVICNDEPA